MEDDVIAKGIVKDVDPKYLYFLDADGNLRKRRKGGKRRKKKYKVNRVFTELNLTLPKILIKAFISKKEKRVIAYGNSGAMISMPREYIGKRGKVIFIPSEAMNEIEENTINLF